MSDSQKTTNVLKSTRRDFLKTTAAGSLGLVAVGSVGIARSAHAAGSDTIKIALIGCGRRGLGSLQDRFKVGDNVKLVALADVAEKPIQAAAKLLRSQDEFKDKLALDDDYFFTGFDGYKHAVESCDQVLVASPPGFHPVHYAYAVEKGKHVFVEKPFSVDAPGYKICMAANQIAEDKKLTVCAGYQRRHQPSYLEWIKRIQDGEIGEVRSTRVYWNGGQVWIRGVRGKTESEMSFQVRDWYFFNWLSGDNIIEQHCHNIDVGNWIHGKGDRLAHPVKCYGMGGRQWRKTPILPYNECGNVFDHHYVEFQFTDGAIMHSQCRQINGCWNSVTEKVEGTKGRGESCWLKPDNGERWDFPKNQNKNAYVEEHIHQADAIRNGKYLHDGWHSATSSMTAVMGRMATYSGKEIAWDEAVEKGSALFPYGKELTFETETPVTPGPDGTYEHAVAIPGIYNPFA
ncbi:MAG: Gfo/Idh/MocA family oxidoreductase [Planctomycetaceae bacterium]|jgi:predicted dehydrogenase|nr:Gfo/Idh/MocA family oxidoreductase [Planctomycetaceae bacterium]